MLKLHHAPRSRSSRIVWLLEEVGAQYEIVLTDIARQDGSGGADPANPHPDKKVPALTDGDTIVTESTAICLYLTDTFPAAGVGAPVGDPLRGAYLTWLAYYAGVIEPVVTLGFAGLGDHPAAVRSWAGRPAMDRRIAKALEAGPYLLGERFTSIDVLVGGMGQFYRQTLPEGPVVDRYLERIGARPARARAGAKDAG